MTDIFSIGYFVKILLSGRKSERRIRVITARDLTKGERKQLKRQNR